MSEVKLEYTEKVTWILKTDFTALIYFVVCLTSLCFLASLWNCNETGQ